MYIYEKKGVPTGVPAGAPLAATRPTYGYANVSGPKVTQESHRVTRSHSRVTQATVAHAAAAWPAPLASASVSSSWMSHAHAVCSAIEMRWHCKVVQVRVDHEASSRCCARESLLRT